MNQVVYLYGFVPRDSPGPPADLTGLDDRPVELLEVGPFQAAVSTLSAEAYGEGQVDGRLGDLAWVARQGAGHERVVTWFADHSTIVPARLFTLFSSRGALREEASARRPLVEERLLRFRDVREWDLKVSYDLEALAPHLGEVLKEAADLEASIQSAGPGRRYLLERRRDEVARRDAATVASDMARGLLERLSGVAAQVTELEIPARNGDLPVVLNAALLVARERADELRGVAAPEAARLEALGLRISLTGPWAPYRFLGESPA